MVVDLRSVVALTVAILGLGILPIFTKGRRGPSWFASLAGLTAALAVLMPWYRMVWWGGQSLDVWMSWEREAVRGYGRVIVDGTNRPFLGLGSLPLGLVVCLASARLALRPRRVRSLATVAPCLLFATIAILAAIDLEVHVPSRLRSDVHPNDGWDWVLDYGLPLQCIAAGCGAFWSFIAHRRSRPQEADADRIRRVLDDAGGRRADASRVLGMTPNVLRKKMRGYGIE
jgi:hypothetical protein